jgi:hypothetical protein
VWTNGPHECGRWPDIEIFHNALLSKLVPIERVDADDGYIREASGYVKCPKSFTNPVETEYMQQQCRNQKKTVNERFQNWECLKVMWRHDII